MTITVSMHSAFAPHNAKHMSIVRYMQQHFDTKQLFRPHAKKGTSVCR